MIEQVGAALAWWRDAGVDCDFADEPANWLAPVDASPGAAAPIAAQPARQAAPPSPEPAGIDRSAMPDTLSGFQEWWLCEPSLDEGRVTGRVAPRGVAGARLMVLVAEPEREDAEVLLSGPQGRLLDAMLAAMGVAPEAAYIASALPRHTPIADWPGLRDRGLGDVLARHVALVCPERLIVFGANLLPLLGHDPAQAPAALTQFNHGGGMIPLLGARALATLAERPRWKAAFWRAWLDWTGGDQA